MKTAYKVIAVILGYYILAQLGIHTTFQPDFIAAWWPPNALLLTILLLNKPRTWSFWLLITVPADLAVNLPVGVPLKMSMAFFTADWLEVILAAAVLKKLYSGNWDFKTARQVALFIPVAVILAPALSGIVGALVTGMIPMQPPYGTRWLRWFLGDALTQLALTPALLVVLSSPLERFKRPTPLRAIESTLLYTTFLASLYISFSGQVLPDTAFSPVVIFVSVPVLLWVAIRYRIRTTFLFCTLLSISSIWIASRGIGPFSSLSQGQNVLGLQAFLILILIPMILLAVAMQEQRDMRHDLLQSNREKEVLLKEIHHRVKNNLQVISALVAFRSGRGSEQPDDRSMLDIQSRISAIALTHEMLYQSSDLTSIEFKAYLDTLVNKLIHFYMVDRERLHLEIQADPVKLILDTAIPCSLVVNELVSNSLEHAFPDGGKGRLKISFQREPGDMYKLKVEDDGVGMPEGFDITTTHSAGLSLVYMIVEQLGGTIQISGPPGTSFQIRFREYHEAGTTMY